MNNTETENTPFFELLITKFMKKAYTISLYHGISGNDTTPAIHYSITTHSTGQTLKGTGNNEERAFSEAIEQAGYAQKNSVYSEVKNHHQVHGVFHKIGSIEFGKIVKRAIL